MMRHLNSFSASGVRNLNKHFPKIQMPGWGGGGMFKLRFDWYITFFYHAIYLNNGGALGPIRNRKTAQKIAKNRKTARNFVQNRKPNKPPHSQSFGSLQNLSFCS